MSLSDEVAGEEVRGAEISSVDGLGPRFQAVTGRPSGWVPAADVFANVDVSLRHLADARGAPNVTVSGMLLLERYASLLVSPPLATLYRQHALLPCALSEVSVRFGDDALPAQLAFATPGTATHEAPDVCRQQLLHVLIEDHLGQVVDAIRQRARLGERLAKGAVANAIANAFLHLSWTDGSCTDGEPAHLVDEALAFLELAGLDRVVIIETVSVDGQPWMYTDRRTCCLTFRTVADRDARQYCVTCPVNSYAGKREMFTQAVRSFRDRLGRKHE